MHRTPRQSDSTAPGLRVAQPETAVGRGLKLFANAGNGEM